MAQAARVLERDLSGVDPEALLSALDAEAGRRLMAFIHGVRAYHGSHGQRTLEEPPTVWSQGSTRLLDYGVTTAEGKGGAPLLVVPSLINRAYILDLTKQRSLMRHLARRGMRPFLVDWGAPEEMERGFSLDDYVAGRLEDALDAVRGLAGRPAAVIGYCMGGLLALALAQRRPAEVAALVLLATPWDFHATDDGAIRLLEASAPTLSTMIETLGVLPVDVLQAMFASLDPYRTPRKFQRFAAVDPDSPRAAMFVALEDWLNDGVPLAGQVARETLFGWYVENAPARGTWRIGGRPVLPAEVSAPSLVVVPERDYIVPPGSAVPLGHALPRAAMRIVPAGHIGMVVGSRAETVLYDPLTDWFVETIG
ncbi:MAG: alpha/beta fold hydrolase [Rhodospirillales bacterium]|nr:alpha/beta fold hydrolase [Rhodospirillales bacterium]